MKRILFISTASKKSGAEISLLTLMTELCRQDFACGIILPEKAGLYYDLPASVEIYITEIRNLQKIKVSNILAQVITIINVAIKIKNIAKKNNYDIIYANSTKASIYGALVKLMTWKKLVWHVRDNIQTNIATRLLTVFSDKIVCVSSFIFNQLPKSTKKEVVYNSIAANFQNKSNSGQNLRYKLVLDRTAIIIGQIGQLIAWKNHELTINALKLVVAQTNKSIHVVFIGENLFDSSQEYKNYLIKLIKFKKLENKISFLGNTNNINCYFDGIDIVVHPAKVEPFGRVIIEAMVKGLPVVAINSGGPAEIIQNSKNGILVEPDDINEFAKAIIKLIENPELRKQVGESGKLHVLNNFSSHRKKDEVEKLFNF